MKIVATSILLMFLSSAFTQTCTSSGGDDFPDIEDYPYRFRCGTEMMHRKDIVSKDYKIIESCNNYYAEGNYFKKDNQIFYSPQYGEFNLVKGASASVFRCEKGSAMDNEYVYYLGKRITDIDVSSFKVVGNLYCMDNNHVYFKNKYSETGKIMQLTSGPHLNFQIIGDSNSYYANDENTVYYYGKAIAESDPASFKVLVYGYAHDKNAAYYNGKKIEGMAGENFEVLKDCYLGSDGVSLCNGADKLPNSDAVSFTAIECGYYKDNNHVYLNGRILENVDCKTFQILSWGYTKDKAAVYCDLKLIKGANASTFEVLSRKYSKDEKDIFYLHQTIDCDYTSFALDNSKDYMAKDKKGKISRGVRE